jgi:hypothetical protein
MIPQIKNIGQNMTARGKHIMQGHAPQYLCLKKKCNIKAPVITKKGTTKRVIGRNIKLIRVIVKRKHRPLSSEK